MFYLAYFMLCYILCFASAAQQVVLDIRVEGAEREGEENLVSGSKSRLSRFRR